MNPARLFSEFLNSEKAGGIILVFATAVSLLVANSAWQSDYNAILLTDLGGHSIVHWIDEGLMTLFFLLIGLELEREIYAGELSNLKKASLPLFGALGGMLVPFGIYFLLNAGSETKSGAGIPMATDIAFAVGILSLLGSRVPLSLKIFLTALAVIDDLGAIIIISVFYTSSLNLLNLFVALGVFSVLLVLNRMRISNLLFYLAGGLIMWYFMQHSGVHATITGVLLAFAVPFGDGGEQSPSFRLQHHLHKPVAFIILPMFALANTSIPIGSNWIDGLREPYSMGIIAGLVLGKPLGIFLFSFIAAALGISVLPSDLKWNNIVGAGLLGGIGFTMSIFITLLAFVEPEMVNNAKIAILVASVIAGTLGFIWLRLSLK